MAEKFLPYQNTWIVDNARYKVWEKSRRIGATFAEAFWSFRRRMTTKIDHVFSSADYKTAKEFLQYVKLFCEAYNLAAGTDVIKPDDMASEWVIFPNGSRILIVSSSPTAFRGLSGDVTLDEFSFHDNAEQLYRAASPVTDWNGGCLHIISTHNGSGTVFNQLINDARQGKNAFKLFHTTLADAVEDGLAEKLKSSHSNLPTKAERGKAYIELVKSKCLNEAMFEQEYMCQVLSASSIVTEQMYDACILPNFKVFRDTLPPDFLDGCGRLYIGIDVGRSKDNTVIWVMEEGVDTKTSNPKLRRTYRTVLVRTLNNVPFESQYQIISGLINHRKVKRVLIENNGIGAGLAEQLENTFIGKVSAWTTTHNNKATAIERLAGWVAQNRIALPSDSDIKQDLMAMQRVISPTGKIAYEGHTAKSHCDAFISAALSLEAGEGEAIPFFDYSIKVTNAT